MNPVPAWQNLLFVPAGNDRLLLSAIRHRPDAVILDLEDAIGPAEKPIARAALRSQQRQLADAGIACVVRVNAPLAMMVEDIAAIDLELLAALLLPKVESIRTIDNACELAADRCGIISLVETPPGVDSLSAIAASPHTIGLMLGSEDLSAVMGINPDEGGLEMPVARIGLVAAGRGLLAIGFPGSIGNLRDLDLYRKQVLRGRNLGMNCVAAIHPSQLPVIREALAPTEKEIAWARSVVASAGTNERSVFASAGTMIDAPVLARAKYIVSRSRGLE